MKAGAEEAGAIKKSFCFDGYRHSPHISVLFSKMTFLLCSLPVFMQDLWFQVGFPEYSLPTVIFYPWIMESLFIKPGCVALEKNT